MICTWVKQKRLHSTFGLEWSLLGSSKILFTAHWVEYDVFLGIVNDALQRFYVEYSLFMGRVKVPLKHFWVEHGLYMGRAKTSSKHFWSSMVFSWV